MKKQTIKLAKFSPLRNHEAPDTMVHIYQEVPSFKDMEEVEAFYTNEADRLADALFESLPQGTLDRLLISLMSRKVSVYKGKTED